MCYCYCLLTGVHHCVTCRERTVQQKVDRSGPVLFSRVRPAIQYQFSTDGLEGWVVGGLNRVGFGPWWIVKQDLVTLQIATQ